MQQDNERVDSSGTLGEGCTLPRFLTEASLVFIVCLDRERLLSTRVMCFATVQVRLTNSRQISTGRNVRILIFEVTTTVEIVHLERVDFGERTIEKEEIVDNCDEDKSDASR